jgi:hypothetical protein
MMYRYLNPSMILWCAKFNKKLHKTIYVIFNAESITNTMCLKFNILLSHTIIFKQ